MRNAKAFTVDMNKCTGCHACEMACQIANCVPGERRWRRVRTFNELHVHGVEVSHLSMSCNHCEEAPCLDACPACAIYRDDTTNAVLIDEDKCVGCRYCSWACPYGAPSFDEGAGVMAKCDFCVQRQREGGEPACVTGCPTGALGWIGLHEAGPEGGPVPGLAAIGAKPSIRVEPLKPGRLAPNQTDPPSIPPWRAPAERITPLITRAHEWTLVLFTALMAALVGLFMGWMLGGPAPNLGAFLAAGVAAFLVSSTHLGRKVRAWRAVSHPHRSWLSREIIFFGAFLALAALELHFGGDDPSGRPLDHVDLSAWAAAACAVAVLVSADSVYRTGTVRGGGLYHSSRLVGTGFLLAVVWSGIAAAAVVIGGIKALLYWRRKRTRGRLGLPSGYPATALRLGTLAAAGAAALWGAPPPVVFALVLASELVDRIEFYGELEIPSPESLMMDELGSRPQVKAAPSPRRDRERR